MIIVKVGGSEGIDYEAVCADVAALVQAGQRLVLVHGGSALTNQVAEQLGHPSRFVTSPSGYTSRFTDRRTLEIFQMVYCGQMNKMIVELLQQQGVNAIGLSGIDGGLWRGRRKDAIRVVENGKKRILRGNLTGTVDEVNVALLTTLLDAGYLPILTPPAISFENEAINVDGDRAARATAAALNAEALVILSNIPGLLRDFPDESTLIDHIPKAELDAYKPFAAGRMRIKLLGAKEALDAGVQRVILGDARIPQPIQAALAGHGTTIS